MSEAVGGGEGLRRFRPPTEIRDSGVPWLGVLPAHWSVKPVKFLASADNSGVWGDEPEECESPLPVATTAHIDPDGSLLVDDMPRRCLSASDARYYQCRVGDIVVVKSSGSATNVISGKAGLVGKNAAGMVFSNFLLRLRPFREGVDPRILFRFLTSSIVKERIRVMVSTTTYPNLRVGEYLRFEVPLAPPDEQRTIAEFLDRETGKIDALVEKKERLIELLQEKRTALITHAVTKGLDPTVPMKPSGIDWLGDIPEHWEVLRTKFAARLESGHTPSRQHPEYWVNCTVPWFGLSDVWQIRDGQREYVAETAEQVSELGLANSSARLLRKGTVILSRTASVGFSAIMATDMATTQDFANWVPGPRLRSEFLLFVLRGMKQEFERLVMGSTHKTIYMPDIGGFSTPLPPIEEQDMIVQYIRERAGRIDPLVARTVEAIDHLREFRTALISAAVTGKIDVRKEVA